MLYIRFAPLAIMVITGISTQLVFQMHMVVFTVYSAYLILLRNPHLYPTTVGDNSVTDTAFLMPSNCSCNTNTSSRQSIFSHCHCSFLLSQMREFTIFPWRNVYLRAEEESCSFFLLECQQSSSFLCVYYWQRETENKTGCITHCLRANCFS